MPTNEHEIKMLSAMILCFLNHLSVLQQTVIFWVNDQLDAQLHYIIRLLL